MFIMMNEARFGVSIKGPGLHAALIDLAQFCMATFAPQVAAKAHVVKNAGRWVCRFDEAAP